MAAANDRFRGQPDVDRLRHQAWSKLLVIDRKVRVRLPLPRIRAIFTPARVFAPVRCMLRMAPWASETSVQITRR